MFTVLLAQYRVHFRNQQVILHEIGWKKKGKMGKKREKLKKLKHSLPKNERTFMKFHQNKCVKHEIS